MHELTDSFSFLQVVLIMSKQLYEAEICMSDNQQKQGEVLTYSLVAYK